VKNSRKGDIYKKSYKGLYCVGTTFVTQKISWTAVRGPQYRSGSSRKKIIFPPFEIFEGIGEKNQDGTRIFPEGRKNEILSLIDSGLEDVSFSARRGRSAWSCRYRETTRRRCTYGAMRL